MRFDGSRWGQRRPTPSAKSQHSPNSTHPYMRPEQITVKEQKRRWGQEPLDGLTSA
jgi:hypothetical protein